LKRLVDVPPDSTTEETIRWRWSPLEPGGGDMLLFLCTQGGDKEDDDELYSTYIIGASFN
jgi:hypothetical protein